MSNDTTRDAFEAWADNARSHQRLRSSTTDNYDYPLGTILFECWQAATEQGKRPPLTEERILTIARATQTAEPGRDGYILPFSFAREIEAAHGITATPQGKILAPCPQPATHDPDHPSSD